MREKKQQKSKWDDMRESEKEWDWEGEIRRKTFVISNKLLDREWWQREANEKWKGARPMKCEAALSDFMVGRV